MSGKKIWVAKVYEKDRNGFEETRRCLLNSYHSYVQNHVGYLITFIIGSVVLISSWKDFWINISGEVIFLSLLVTLGCALVYMISRTHYWTSYAGNTLYMPLEDAIRLFNEYNSRSKTPYLEEAPAPYTAILQSAIWQKIENNKNTRL